MEYKTKKTILNIFIAVFSVALVGGIASIFSNPNTDWFVALNKPSQFLPNIVFPIVWGVIYCSFAVYIFFMLQAGTLEGSTLGLLIINGVLNILWCLVFFTLNSLLGGLVLIILNLVLAIILVKNIFKNNGFWGYILSIYPFWLMLATVLNVSTFILN